MKNRAIHRAYARTWGYFWLPCPLCGQEFGGHEWHSIDGKTPSIPAPDGPQGLSIGICPDCTKAGKGYEDPLWLAAADRWREQFFDSHPELTPREENK